MRLFGKVNSTIDRFDRAEWLTPPFDKASSSVSITRYTLIGTEQGHTVIIGTRLETTALMGTQAANVVTDYDAEIDDLLVASPTGSYKELFSTEDFTGNGSVWNVDGWAASMDFTGKAMLSVESDGSTPNATADQNGTLVSPRHGIMADHTSHEVGDLVTWIAADGTRYRRAILGLETIGATDIQVAYYGLPGLDGDDVATSADLDTNILRNYRVLPVDYPDLIDGFPELGGGVIADKPPVVFLDQDRKALVREWSQVFNVSGFGVKHVTATEGDRGDYSENVASGDSGQPTLVLLHGELVLLGTHFGPTGVTSNDPFTTLYIDEINTAMANLETAHAGSGETTGYQLKQWALPTTPSDPITLIGA